MMTCLVMGVLLCVLGLLLTFFIIYNCEKIKLALDVIDAASDFTAKTKRIIFVPIVHFIVGCIVLGFWIASMICVVAMNDIKADKTTP